MEENKNINHNSIKSNELANKIEQTRLRQNNFNISGNGLGYNPFNRNTLSNLQTPHQSNIDSDINSGISSDIEDNDLNSSNIDDFPTSNSEEQSSNSGFENSQSGLFSPFKKEENKDEKNNNLFRFNKKKKNIKTKIAIFGTVAGILILFICVITVSFVVMGQVMTVRDSITRLANKFTTGVEKFVNFAQGDGWMTEEGVFFDYLEKEYKKFPSSGGKDLDIPLIAATIHYSKTVDLSQYEEEEGTEDLDYDDEEFEQLGGMLNKDQTVSFYKVAQDKLGSVNTIYPGQKRLLGHLVDTEITIESLPAEQSLHEWKTFLNYISQSAGDTADDIFTAMNKFITIYEDYYAYYEMTGDAFAGQKYNQANLIYEAQEFYYNFHQLYEKIVGNVQTYIDEQGNKRVSRDQNGNIISISNWFNIPTPIVERSMNYGYDEYKQMKQDLLKMKAILNNKNINYTTDEDVLNEAENSTNSELKSLYDSYKENEEIYMYSYTHYLKTVYIPFTYFYNQQYTDLQIDVIIDEIYSQRDFYEYLVEGNKKKSGCGSTQAEDLVDLTHEEFIEFIGPLARLDYSKTGILASVTIAQAILETGYGNVVFEGTNNLFNIKCGSWHNCASFETGEEYTPGVFTPIVDDFRVYESVEESIEDHSRVLLGDRYAGITDTADYREQIRIIKEGGYATSSTYDQIYLELIEDWNLTRWDTIVDTTSSSNTCVVGDYAEWKQYDSQWGNVPMTSGAVCGGNVCTIQSIGCLVTSVAIQIARSGVPVQNISGDFNPGTFVTAIRKAGSIDSGGNFSGNVEYVAPTFKYISSQSIVGLTQTQKAQTIDNFIEQGYYVIMEVKSGCGIGQHWVAIDRVEGNKVYMFDPGSPSTVVWEQYPYSCSSRLLLYKVS